MFRVLIHTSEAKEQKKSAGGDGHVHSLDCSDVIMSVCICPNSSKCSFLYMYTSIKRTSDSYKLKINNQL